MSDTSAVVVFTFKSVKRILQEGGTSSWRLERSNARKCKVVVCTRNANHEEVEGTEDHHSAFLVGKISDVVPSPKHPDRYLIQFSEYARIDIPEVWKGDRNPVRYTSLEKLGIDPSTLKWERMPEVNEHGEPSSKVASVTTGSPLTMAEAKKGLALTFGVTPEAIEITIRG